MQAVKTALLTLSVTLYTGVTGDIFHRALEHKAGEIEGFTKKYHINRLVYYETFKYVNNALAREKQVRLGRVRSALPDQDDCGMAGFGGRLG
jgi:predicted GIY-YIG superfamily endonuclease